MMKVIKGGRMQVSSYVFQSPYPSAVQVGRPDPLAQSQENSDSAVDSLSDVGNQTKRDAQAYKTQVSTGASVNVAASSMDSAVSGSLGEFTSLNAQTQATEAYSS